MRFLPNHGLLAVRLDFLSQRCHAPARAFPSSGTPQADNGKPSLAVTHVPRIGIGRKTAALAVKGVNGSNVNQPR